MSAAQDAGSTGTPTKRISVHGISMSGARHCDDAQGSIQNEACKACGGGARSGIRQLRQVRRDRMQERQQSWSCSDNWHSV